MPCPIPCCDCDLWRITWTLRGFWNIAGGLQFQVHQDGDTQLVFVTSLAGANPCSTRMCNWRDCTAAFTVDDAVEATAADCVNGPTFFGSVAGENVYERTSVGVCFDGSAQNNYLFNFVADVDMSLVGNQGIAQGNLGWFTIAMCPDNGICTVGQGRPCFSGGLTPAWYIEINVSNVCNNLGAVPGVYTVRSTISGNPVVGSATVEAA